MHTAKTDQTRVFARHTCLFVGFVVLWTLLSFQMEAFKLTHEPRRVGAEMSTPKMSTPKTSTPKMSAVPKCLFPKCLLCQNVYSQNVCS